MTTKIEPVQTTFQGPMDIGQHRVGDAVVSTRYFGLGALYGDPVYWETMVLEAGEEVDRWTQRYDSREAATLGHETTIRKVATNETREPSVSQRAD